MSHEKELLNALRATCASYERISEAIEKLSNIIEKSLESQEKVIELSLKMVDLKNPEKKKIQTPQDHYIS